MSTRPILLTRLLAGLTLSCLAATPVFALSTARQWDEEILAGIRIDIPKPPVHARNLCDLSICMWDAWAAYDATAVGIGYHGKPAVPSGMTLAQARDKAISYAAWRMLRERYALSKNAATTLPLLDARLTTLGYSTSSTTRDTTTAEGVGSSVYDAVSAYCLNDGSNQTYSPAYSDPSYFPSNQPMITGQPFNTAPGYLPNVWQPLAITDAQTQNGIPADSIQKYIGSQWLVARPFALSRDDSAKPWIDPGIPPLLNSDRDAQFRNELVDVIRKSGELDANDGVTMNIDPGHWGGNSLGANDGTGYPGGINPITGNPYAPNVVKRGDFTRVLAEFWADGPNSETPPGHWNSLANTVTDSPGFVRKIGGTGPVVSDLEWDVKLYVALNTAVHDAACAAWGLKRYYEGPRPISNIRWMGQQGQSSNPLLPSYSPNGLPLLPDVVELVTNATIASGRHSAANGLYAGVIAIKAWSGQPGTPGNPGSGASGVRWYPAYSWIPFQAKTFVTPAFPGYVSGHSTFSRAAAEVLTSITGSPFFPNGLGSFTAPASTYLKFESGPTQQVRLEWGTYYDAADQAGLSRIWGGIHVSVDDLEGRKAGAKCGKGAWALAKKYFDGSVLTTPFNITSVQPAGSGTIQVKSETTRGLYYKLQQSPDMSANSWTDVAGTTTQAVDTSITYSVTTSAARRFYQVVRTTQP